MQRPPDDPAPIAHEVTGQAQHGTAAEESRGMRLERFVSALKTWLSAIRGIPKFLSIILVGSIVSGAALAWFWFLSRDLVVVRWLALPWLMLVAVPQFGLWLLNRSLRELLELPERLAAVKAGVEEHGEQALRLLRRVEADDQPRGGFLSKLKEAYSLHGELSAIVATRAVFSRLTGRLAIFIGPVSFLLNCLIIGVGIIQLLILFG